MAGMVMVREAETGDWQLLRDVRLAALREAPYAFGSTYAREAAFGQEQWLDRLNSRSVTFFAYRQASSADKGKGEERVASADGGEPAGLAGVYEEEDGTAEVVSMWVRPAARGLGVGQALVESAADWAKARAHETLYLWVTESNSTARTLYERCGFTPTGERQPLPSDPSLDEIRMRRAL
jgi:GNAT superfamily N-acetyltransferase